MEQRPSSSLEEQLHELRSRISQLEQALRRHGIPLEQQEGRPQAEKIHPEASAAALPPSPASRSQAPPAPALARSEQTPRSLESRIGSQWFNRIGILAVLIGMAWFLKWAIDNHWIGPLSRVVIGLVAGAAIILWSERFERKGYAWFSYSLKAIGSGILYLSLWAAFSLLHLISAALAFAGMIAVTAFNGFHAWRKDAEILALYAVAGGFITPFLLTTGDDREIALFGYLFLLDLAVLALVALRPWSRLLLAAFFGTAIYCVIWWFVYYSLAQSWRTAVFLGCFFLIFCGAPHLIRPVTGTTGRLTRWDNLALFVLPTVNAALGFLGFYAILKTRDADSAAAWLALAFAAFYLALRLPARGIPGRRSPLLSTLHLTIAAVFLIVALPLKTHGRWMTIGWLAEGAALLWASTRMKTKALSILALVCLVLGFFALIFVNPAASPTPFLNQRFGAFCAGIAAFAFVSWIASRQLRHQSEQFALSWKQLARVAALAVNGLILLAIGWEIHSYWRNIHPQADWQEVQNHWMYAQFTYSAFFMLFGAALLALGFARRSAFLRWQALALLAIAIGKVFLVDVDQLRQAYRILSFLGLGALLLAVSFAYQRNWLKRFTKDVS